MLSLIRLAEINPPAAGLNMWRLYAINLCLWVFSHEEWSSTEKDSDSGQTNAISYEAFVVHTYIR